MKKIILFLFIVTAGIGANAQLSKTKWSGTLMLDQPVNITLDFAKDTLVAITPDGGTLETMTFTVKDNVLSITKAFGQSDCGTDVTGKYKFDIKADSMEFTLVEDICYNRAGVLDKTKWTKVKK
ncbi:MAG: hypothetical protein JNL23_10860 [Chitinophagaceae bacterium]|nr:hypothetical protein [Chitinophagaceae bacterium]